MDGCRGRSCEVLQSSKSTGKGIDGKNQLKSKMRAGLISKQVNKDGEKRREEKEREDTSILEISQRG